MDAMTCRKIPKNSIIFMGNLEILRRNEMSRFMECGPELGLRLLI